MAEYIKREDAIKVVNGQSVLTMSRKRIIDQINVIPAADVAPVVHARWIPFHSEVAGDIQYCSACEIGFTAKMDFCPNCGAKMDL